MNKPEKKELDSNEYIVYDNCGKNLTNLELIDWCKEVERKGAGEILINSIEKDGTLKGYDLNLIKLVEVHEGQVDFDELHRSIF